MPVSFQMFGADANQLAPRDLLDQGMEQPLNDAGTPVELYNGSLQLQTAPVALRLFESTWHHLVHDANDLLAWAVEQIARLLSWETVDARLKRVTIADNLCSGTWATSGRRSRSRSPTRPSTRPSWPPAPRRSLPSTWPRCWPATWATPGAYAFTASRKTAA